MIYLDSSALLKLVRQEVETAALLEWLREHRAPSVITSEVGRIEVLRAARRIGGRALTQARAVVGDLDVVPLNRAVQDLACEIADPLLRTLDALHLASAVLLSEELTVFISYDHRLSAAARAADLAVVTPGQSHGPWGG